MGRKEHGGKREQCNIYGKLGVEYVQSIYIYIYTYIYIYVCVYMYICVCVYKYSLYLFIKLIHTHIHAIYIYIYVISEGFTRTGFTRQGSVYSVCLEFCIEFCKKLT